MPGLTLIARNPAVDFTNTPFDSWKDVRAFLETCRLPKGPKLHGKTADSMLDAARVLRADLALILRALIENEPIKPSWVRQINRILAAEAGHLQLERDKSLWKLARVQEPGEALHTLLPIAHAAAGFIVEGPACGVRKCANPACPLFFLDKSGRRRWCSMATCGNRAKVSAHWRRTRPAATPESSEPRPDTTVAPQTPL